MIEARRPGTGVRHPQSDSMARAAKAPSSTPDGDDPGSRSTELVARAQAGDDQALNELLERYYPRVLRVVRILLGHPLRRHIESGDILQGTFVGAVAAFDRFEMRNESSLIHWLAKIAEHQIKDAADYHLAAKRDVRRNVARAGVAEGQISGEPVLEPEAPQIPLLDGLIASEDIDLALDALQEIKESYRDVIVARHWEGGSWEEVAEMIGSASPDAARMQYSRALTALTKALKRRGGPDQG